MENQAKSGGKKKPMTQNISLKNLSEHWKRLWELNMAFFEEIWSQISDILLIIRQIYDAFDNPNLTQILFIW